MCQVFDAFLAELFLVFFLEKKNKTIPICIKKEKNTRNWK
jgi:hypothetical protein